MNEDIKVSVICNAYNHGNYIRDALESFVMQETNFAYEVLVHDDASTDDTAKIIEEYAEKYPDIIKPILQKENQYSKGVLITKEYQVSRAKGKYIAFCEGDDYWSDKHKLQKQFEAMENHPEADMCTHKADRIAADAKKFFSPVPAGYQTGIIPVEDVILGGGGFVATNSLFYRKSIWENELQFRKDMSYDYTLQISGALRGGLYYIDDIMSVYRMNAPGSWSARMNSSVDKQVGHFEKQISMLRQLDKDTEGKFKSAIEKRILALEFTILERKKNYRALKKNPYKEVYLSQSFRKKLKINLGIYCPKLAEAVKIIRKK